MKSRRSMSGGVIAIVSLLSTVGSASAQTSAAVVFDAAIPAIRFAAGDVQAALRAKGVVVQTAASGPARESVDRRPDRDHDDRHLAGRSAIGERIDHTGLRDPQGHRGNIVAVVGDRCRRRWRDVRRSGARRGDTDRRQPVRRRRPAGQSHIARRGIKFNIPLDARTPSYSDDSTSAQANIPRCGAWTSGPRSWTTARGIATTCSRSGA